MLRAIRILFSFGMLALSVFIVIVGAHELKTSDWPLLENPWSIATFASVFCIPITAWTLFRSLNARWKGLPTDASAVIRFRQPIAERWFGWAGVAFALGISVMVFKQSQGDLGQIAIAVVVAIASIVGLAVSMKKPAAELVLSPAGLDYNRFGVGPIAWEDVVAADVIGGHSSESVRLTLRDPLRYKDPASGGKKEKPFLIPCRSVGAPAAALAEAINLRRSVYSF
jgi:hypothetical protein